MCDYRSSGPFISHIISLFLKKIYLLTKLQKYPIIYIIMTEIDVTRLSPEAEELQVRANTDLKFAGLTSATTLALSAIGIFLANKAGIDYGSIRYTDQLLAGGATTAALGTYLLSGRHYLRAAWNRLRASRARTDEEASLPPERVSYGTVSEMVRS